MENISDDSPGSASIFSAFCAFIASHMCCVLPILQIVFASSVALASLAPYVHFAGNFLIPISAIMVIYLTYKYVRGFIKSKRNNMALNYKKVFMRISFIIFGILSVIFSSYMHFFVHSNHHHH